MKKTIRFICLNKILNFGAESIRSVKIFRLTFDFMFSGIFRSDTISS